MSSDLEKLQNKSKGMLIDGIGSSECIDTSNEIADIEGMDISSLEEGDGVLNWEHRNDKSPGASPLDIVGKIIYVKKIFKKDDCETDRQRMYWDKVECPYLYFITRLFDGAGHEAAKALAAIFRDGHANGEPIFTRYSIEGSTLLKEDNRLKKTVVRRITCTIKPANRSAESGVLADPNAPEGFDKTPVKETKDLLADIGKSEEIDLMYANLGGYTVSGSVVTDEDSLVKTYTAGSYNVAPGQLTGGAALQREDRGLSHKIKQVVKSYLETSTGKWDKTGFTKFLKHQLPEADDSFINYFADMVDDVRVKNLAKNELFEADDDEPAKETNRGLTIQGAAITANPQVQKPYFDSTTGVLHTKRGSFPMYIPSRDPNPKGLDSWNAIMGSDNVANYHTNAMKSWGKLHKLAKKGKIPEEVVMHAALFSVLSTNTPVMIQENMYGNIVDSMNQNKIDARSPEFKNLKQDWLDRDQPGRLPIHSNEYFRGLTSLRVGKPTNQLGPFGNLVYEGKTTATGREPGEIQPFSLANDKFDRMADYHLMHDGLVKIISKYKADGRKATQDLMGHKLAAESWEKKRRQAVQAGKADPGPYSKGPGMYGLAPKTTRYMLGMLGMGNQIVPDTHLVRHLFGLKKEVDKDSIKHLKNLLWDPKNSEIMNAIDQYYGLHHDSVKDLLKNANYAGLFKKPEDAIFPAFWKHWLAINPHERARGFGNYKASNEIVDHTPFWEAVEPYLGKSEEPTEVEETPVPVKTAKQHLAWVNQYGAMPAMFLYHTHLVPQLLAAEESRLGTADMIKSEGIELAKMAIRDLKPGQQSDPDKDKLGYTSYDYNHLIPEQHRQDYKLIVKSRPLTSNSDNHYSKALIYHLPTQRCVGEVAGYLRGKFPGLDEPDLSDSDKVIDIGASELYPEHHNKGLGRAMYEAIMAHGYHNYGAKRVVGDIHSSMAERVHNSIKRIHNTDYRPLGQNPNWNGKIGANDGKNIGYDYKIDKSEIIFKFENLAIELNKTAEEIKSSHHVVSFGGQLVQPGVAVIPYLGKELALLHDTGTHYVAIDKTDLSNKPDASKFVKLNKLHAGKKYDVIAKPKPYSENTVIDANIHGNPAFNKDKHQLSLIHNVDTAKWKRNCPAHADTGQGFWVKAGNDKLAYAKSTKPKHEVLFYNMAKYLGLGDYVPPTAIFKHPQTQDLYSLQQMVDKPLTPAFSNIIKETMPRESVLYSGGAFPIGKEGKILKELGDKGELDKLAMLDMVMGSKDRHAFNYVFSGKDNSIKLIDNEDILNNEFDPVLAAYPSYLAHYQNLYGGKDFLIHKAAKEWIQSIDPEEFTQELRNHGVGEHKALEAARRLLRLQLVSKANHPITQKQLPMVAFGNQ